MHKIPLALRALLLVSLAVLLAWARPASAQSERLSLDLIYDPEQSLDFTGAVPTGLDWLDDERFVMRQPSEDDRPARVAIVTAATGETTPLIDGARLESALAAVTGLTAEDAAQAARGQLIWSQDRDAVVVLVHDDLYHYDHGSGALRRLTSTPGTEEEVTFSPDGRLVAFVRDHDLFVVGVADAAERALTTDGGPSRLNGKLDWVYQEEIYGRGRYRAYWWSPDSDRLAFLQLDETGVPQFTVVDHIPYRLETEVYPYPKAGDTNPTARLGVVRAAGGPIVWMNASKYTGTELLIVDVGWTPDGTRVVYQVQDRVQTWLDLNLGQAASGETTTIVHETSDAWVDAAPTPLYLEDGGFLWVSERTGWRHVYRYHADGTLAGQVTSGEWEVRDVHGVGADGWLYLSGTERSPIGLDVYRVQLDGSGLTRLSDREGTHRATFNPSMTSYLDTWSDLTTPPQVRLHAADDGRELRAVHDEPVADLAGLRLSVPELLQVETRDGFVMEAMMIKPPDFDPTRTYPVYQHTYGGPHAQQVVNAWGGTTYMYHQLLAQQGIIVWMCDNRTASGKGAVSARQVYRRFGELELRDIEDGIAWLERQPYVDAGRIGINGWSYGGFMVSYALTHSDRFAMGIAGGSVTDWRDYDTIYTERFMGLPQENADGYRASSPRFAAEHLQGQLLLLHGLTDDNVHVQNTIQFMYALQRAGKPFELMLYPRSRHGISNPRQVLHLRRTMLAFTLRTLRPDGSVDDVSSAP